MPVRKYFHYFMVPSDPPFEEFLSVEKKIIRAKNKRVANEVALKYEQENDIKRKGAVISEAQVRRQRRDMNQGFRNINADLRPSFDLRHRHKGRPIKGRRNCPVPHIRCSITNRPYNPENSDG